MITFLKALPGLVTLILELIKFIKNKGWQDPATKVTEIAEAVKMQREAVTREEKINAARALSRVLRRL